MGGGGEGHGEKGEEGGPTLMTSEDKGCIAPVHFMSCSTPVFLPLRYILLRAARTAGSRWTHSCCCNKKSKLYAMRRHNDELLYPEAAQDCCPRTATLLHHTHSHTCAQSQSIALRSAAGC